MESVKICGLVVAQSAVPAGGGVLPLVVMGLIAVAMLVLVIVLLQFVNLYVQALVSNAQVGFVDLVGMKLRKVDLRTVVINRIRLVKAGFDIPVVTLETHVLAGGRLSNVVTASIAAKGAGVELPWNVATAIDLVGRDVVQVVKEAAEPRLVVCEGQSGRGVRGVTADGSAVGLRAELSVRVEPLRVVGGAGEEHLRARVERLLGKMIAGAPSVAALREQEGSLGAWLVTQGLGKGTCYEVESVEVDVLA